MADKVNNVDLAALAKTVEAARAKARRAAAALRVEI